jgi:hypothetical protein
MKIIQLVLFYLLVLTFASCKKINKIVVGQSLGGGTVAYVDETGKHGIIAANSDQSNGIMWQQGTYNATLQTTIFDVTNATGAAIGTGKSNTDLILAKQGTTGRPFPAAALTLTYNSGGYTDWHLPSKDELYQLYLNRTKIGGFTSNWYWSSTEKNAWYAEALDFGTGNFDSLGGYKGPGGTPYYVRLVRKF